MLLVVTNIKLAAFIEAVIAKLLFLQNYQYLKAAYRHDDEVNDPEFLSYDTAGACPHNTVGNAAALK